MSNAEAQNPNGELVSESGGDPAAIIEAVLFAGGAPSTLTQLTELLGAQSPELVIESVARLNQRYHRQGRPYEVRRAGTAYQLILRPQFASIVRRLHGRTREVRLSVPAIEVLSLVAYRQPITHHEINAVRGLDSGPILRQLRKRNLIEQFAAEEDHRTQKYRTTRRFLDLFHIRSLDELPRVQELDRP